MLETNMSTTHCHEWRINLGCSDTLPAHHHSHHTLRMWWASSVASLPLQSPIQFRHDVKMLTLVLRLLGILAGGSHSCEPETSSGALTSSEYAIPQSPLLLPFLVLVAVTAAAAVWAIHRQLSRTTLQYASHSQPLQRQHMLFECPFCFLLRCVCASFPFTCDGRARGGLV
jgi:hypothetical protein